MGNSHQGAKVDGPLNASKKESNLCYEQSLVGIQSLIIPEAGLLSMENQ